MLNLTKFCSKKHKPLQRTLLNLIKFFSSKSKNLKNANLNLTGSFSNNPKVSDISMLNLTDFCMLKKLKKYNLESDQVVYKTYLKIP